MFAVARLTVIICVQITHLDLSWNDLGADGGLALLEGPWLNRCAVIMLFFLREFGCLPARRPETQQHRSGLSA